MAFSAEKLESSHRINTRSPGPQKTLTDAKRPPRLSPGDAESFPLSHELQRQGCAGRGPGRELRAATRVGRVGRETSAILWGTTRPSSPAFHCPPPRRERASEGVNRGKDLSVHPWGCKDFGPVARGAGRVTHLEAVSCPDDNGTSPEGPALLVWGQFHPDTRF